MQSVYNNEFRDKAGHSAYPFTSASTMREGNVVIATECFLDASIYPLVPHKAPFFVSQLDISTDVSPCLKVVITDADNMKVGTALCSSDSPDTAMVVDIHDSIIGVLVYTPARVKEVLGALSRKPLYLAPNALQFTAGVCHATETEGNRMFLADDVKFQGDIVIAAAGGVQFESINPQGDLSVNLYGEMYTLDAPIVSINGRVMDNVWLAAHPDAGVRIVTDSDEKIIIGKPREFN